MQAQWLSSSVLQADMWHSQGEESFREGARTEAKKEIKTLVPPQIKKKGGEERQFWGCSKPLCRAE